MAQHFIQSRRDQGFLLPPDVRDWLSADHLAWFVIAAVAQIDLAAIYGAYRADGHGAAAYEPSVMVTLLLYAYATKQRSSRAVECHCRQDVAYRVITGNVVPDHATIARFEVRHDAALAELFGEVLKLCDRGGLVRAGVVAIDGTRLAGNASKDRNRGFERIAEVIRPQAKAADEAEDQQHADARGDDLPEQLRTAEGRPDPGLESGGIGAVRLARSLRAFFDHVRHGRDAQSAIGHEGDEQLAASGEALTSEPPENGTSDTEAPNHDASGVQGPDREAPAARATDHQA